MKKGHYKIAKYPEIKSSKQSENLSSLPPVYDKKYSKYQTCHEGEAPKKKQEKEGHLSHFQWPSPLSKKEHP